MEVIRIVFSYKTVKHKKWSFFTNKKEYLSEKVTSFLKKMKTMKKKLEIIR